jgi:phosphorylase kinase gamma subunit
VRRCIEKETGIEYAAKIIDISNETNEDGYTMKDATLQEVQILRKVAGHPYISKFSCCRNFFLPSRLAIPKVN